jgi:hypothetical protein
MCGFDRVLRVWLLCIAVFTALPPNAADARSNPNEKWGALIDVIARLTWAEKYCPGRASDGVRELRLHLRNTIPGELEEAFLRDQTEAREIVADKLDDKAAVEATCIAVSALYGSRGSRLPGLWQDNHVSPPIIQHANGDTHLLPYGEFVRVLAEISYMKPLCSGAVTDLAREFIEVFIRSAGKAAFQKSVDDEVLLYSLPGAYVEGACNRLDGAYGPYAAQWPTLWIGRTKPPLGQATGSAESDPLGRGVSDAGIAPFERTESPLINEKALSHFILVRLPRGIELQLPRGWWVLGSELMGAIDTALVAALDLSSTQTRLDKRVSLLAANSMPPSTYAGIRVNAMPPLLTSEELASIASGSGTASTNAQAAIKAALQQQDKQLLEFSEIRLDTISGLPALVIEYRRSGPKGSVRVQINRIVTPTQEVSISLYYRESEAAIWKPVIGKIRRTIVARQ